MNLERIAGPDGPEYRAVLCNTRKNACISIYKMNILFTTSAAPRSSPFSTEEKRPPLGIGTLISLLRKEGHQVFFIDNYLNPVRFIEQGYLQKNHIDCLGIYANTICWQDNAAHAAGGR